MPPPLILVVGEAGCTVDMASGAGIIPILMTAFLLPNGT